MKHHKKVLSVRVFGIISTALVIGLLALPLTGCPPEPDPPPPDGTPTAADFHFNGHRHRYNADPNIEYKLTITPKSGKSTGTITIHYEGIEGTNYTKSPTSPSALSLATDEEAKYAVTFDVAAAKGGKR